MIKMVIKYSYNKRISPTQLFELYHSVGWADNKNKKIHGKLISNAYGNSQVVISAWDGKNLVGVVRGLTDKFANGIVFGLAVKPEYRGKGLGTKLVKLCISQYPKLKWYVAAEDKKKTNFIQRLGFKKDKYLWFSKGHWRI